MKRSQAIDILDKAIKKSIISHDEMVPAYNIEDIFNALEKAGMLPPDNGKEAYDVLDYRSKCLRWEPEDE